MMISSICWFYSVRSKVHRGEHGCASGLQAACTAMRDAMTTNIDWLVQIAGKTCTLPCTVARK